MTYAEFCARFNIHGLNPQQEKAVQKTEGATLLLAVPGSGKTTVVVARTGYMMFVKNIPFQNILTLTYTRAAASEMAERFRAKFQTAPEVTPKFATINSFAVSVLRIYANAHTDFKLPSLLNNNTELIREIACGMLREYPSDTTIKDLAQKIGKAKNLMWSETDIRACKLEPLDFAKFFHQYQDMLAQRNQMDFDDQLIMAYDILKNTPGLLKFLSHKYKYVSLDEAQDTSLIQHRIVQLLVGRNGNIFEVGDEDQSIYGFRGAYPEALLSFTRDFNNAEVLYMETNYRSDSSIVAATNTFIKRNEMRNPKEMRPNTTDLGKITITHIPKLQDEPKLLLSRVKEALRSPDRTMAVLSRNNESLVSLLNILILNGISVRTRDVTATYFSHPVVLDLLTFLQFALDQTNAEVFLNLYYKLGLFLSKGAAMEAVRRSQTYPPRKLSLLEELAEMDFKPQIVKKLNAFAKMFQKAGSMKPAAAIDYVLNTIGYKDSWMERKIDNGTSRQTLLYKINILKIIAGEYGTIPEFFAAIQRLKDYQSNPSSNVTLSTIHSSKGLEFDKVVLIDALDGIFPANFAAATKNDIEEEARLFYVAATRAKHSLEFVVAKGLFDQAFSLSEYLVMFEGISKDGTPTPANLKASVSRQIERVRRANADRRTRYSMAGATPNVASVPCVKQPPSFRKNGPATQEMGKKTAPGIDLSNLRPGAMVEHVKFGRGTVISVSAGGVISARFGEAGEKKFLRDTCEKQSLLKIV